MYGAYRYFAFLLGYIHSESKMPTTYAFPINWHPFWKGLVFLRKQQQHNIYTVTSNNSYLHDILIPSLSSLHYPIHGEVCTNRSHLTVGHHTDSLGGVTITAIF
jgi:capsule polysaccharide modification protein KpsS